MFKDSRLKKKQPDSDPKTAKKPVLAYNFQQNQFLT